ncbi:MAG TPA: SURF1 family protein [Burkholderiales bacterium]|nr:SURF1 family protein [Burkholderiales bacterium]
MVMTVGGRRFQPLWRWLPIALVGVVVFVALGNWQLRRAEERRALAAAHRTALEAAPVTLPAQPVDAAAYALRRVVAHGHFIPAQTIYLDNRIRQGRVGYEIVTPLRLSGSALHVAILRGWIAGTGSRSALPRVATPEGEQRIEGIALLTIPQRFEPEGAQPEGRVWQNLSVARVAAATRLAFQPLLLEQRSEVDDGLSRDWPQRGAGAEKNENYALQWFSLAALCVVLWLVLSFRRDAPAA